MPNPGEALHKLVEYIEKSTNASENVTFESPCRVADKDTGKLREHDVVITFRHAHHNMRTALECRDRSRKVGVPEVEAFSKKCEKTGIHRGIIVSAKGFTQTAIAKAAALELGCLMLEQALGFNWCLAPGIDVRNRIIDHAHVNIVANKNVSATAKVYEEPHTLLSPEHVNGIALTCLNTLTDDDLTDNGREVLFINKKPELYIIEDDGERIDVIEIRVLVNYHVETKLLPLEFHQYIDAAKGNMIYSIASAEIAVGDTQGRLMMVNEEGVGTKVVWVGGAQKA